DMTKLQANICLLAATFCWSVEVILFKMIPDGVPSSAVICIVNLIAALVLGIVFWRKVWVGITKRMILDAFILAGLNAAYNLLILEFTKDVEAMQAAFLLTMTTVLLPFVALLMGRKSERRTYICVLVMFVGILIGYKETLTTQSVILFLCMLIPAGLRIIYIIRQNDAAKKYEPIQILVLMCAMMGGISFILWSIKQPGTFMMLPLDGKLISGLFAYSYFVSIMAGLLNIVANRYTTPQNASVIYSFEILMTVIMAMTLPAVLGERETLSIQTIVGCAVVTISAILAEINFKKKTVRISMGAQR
ncbi:MAG: DMT family transporter, partial [Christensenella sp.]